MDSGNNINLTFEQAITRLEEIVRALEGGNAPLDKSLELFEEGVVLVRLCNEKLDNAEARVKIVVSGTDGTKSEESFAQ